MRLACPAPSCFCWGFLNGCGSPRLLARVIYLKPLALVVGSSMFPAHVMPAGLPSQTSRLVGLASDLTSEIKAVSGHFRQKGTGPDPTALGRECLL